MKKETIEKLFRRYIGIYDDVVFRTTGEHISENEINTVNDQVDQLFKEYEHVETLNDFTQFTKKIQEILTNTTESASKLNKDQQEKTLNEIYWRFNNDPFGLIQERLDYVTKNIQVDKKDLNKFYIPADPDLEKIGKKYGIKYYCTYDPSTYVTPNIISQMKWVDNIFEENRIIQWINNMINDINNIPLQFCIETIYKYFGNNKKEDVLYSLLSLKNDAKNKIIKYALSITDTPNIKDENYISILCKKIDGDISKDENIVINFPYPEEYDDIFIDNFIKTIPSREKILNDHFEMWEKYIINFNKRQQKELKKRIQIIKAYKDNLTDASVIRFQNITNLLNNNIIYDNIKIETTLLINELETLKFKNGELNTYTEKYSNVINELSNTIKITDLSQNTKDMVFYVIKPMIDEFNKQYKYKYQWLYAKSLLKKIIKIK